MVVARDEILTICCEKLEVSPADLVTSPNLAASYSLVSSHLSLVLASPFRTLQLPVYALLAGRTVQSRIKPTLPLFRRPSAPIKHERTIQPVQVLL